MFKWAKSNDLVIFRRELRENPWLKKFLLKYCFDDSFVFFDQRSVFLKIKPRRPELDFKALFFDHIKFQRHELLREPKQLESFEYLMYVLQRLKKDIKKHYDILMPYLVQLKDEDVVVVIDILMKDFTLTEEQLNILRGV